MDTESGSPNDPETWEEFYDREEEAVQVFDTKLGEKLAEGYQRVETILDV